MSENACIKRLEAVKSGSIPCDLDFSLQDRQLVISAADGRA